MLKKVFLLLFFSVAISFAKAQSIEPKGYFMSDSIQIGQPVPYVLSVKYPKKLELVFPDSLYNFSPFELERKVYFPTRSDSVFSKDSAVFYLSTFEIDSVQYLKLPVYVINEFDSTTLWTETDSIILQHVVTEMPDSVAMKTNTEYVEVPMEFNYPYFTIGSIILIILIIAIYLIFGKTVRKKLKIRRLNKRFIRFEQEFDYLVDKTPTKCEPILKLWKTFIESVTSQPYQKLTTKEIIAQIKDNKLEEALMAIDRNIYGPKEATLLPNAYSIIRDLAIRLYNEKLEEIENG